MLVVSSVHSTFSALVKQTGNASRLMTCFISELESFRKYGPPKIAGPIMTMEDHDFAMAHNRVELHNTGEVPNDDTAEVTVTVADISGDDTLEETEIANEAAKVDEYDVIAVPNDEDEKLTGMETLILTFVSLMTVIMARFSFAKIVAVMAAIMFAGLCWSCANVGITDRAGTDTMVTVSGENVFRALVHCYANATIEATDVKHSGAETCYRLSVLPGQWYCGMMMLPVSVHQLNMTEEDRSNNITYNIGHVSSVTVTCQCCCSAQCSVSTLSVPGACLSCVMLPPDLIYTKKLVTDEDNVIKDTLAVSDTVHEDMFETSTNLATVTHSYLTSSLCVQHANRL